ncbi:MAG: hypothetical protein JST52_08245 [Bacteroidetes bacterium]|nr:hypothetical protein [Bacteroidota bacterium]MBS1739259.1 hypothetical protein [Bacteroidota bacterium]
MIKRVIYASLLLGLCSCQMAVTRQLRCEQPTKRSVRNMPLPKIYASIQMGSRYAMPYRKNINDENGYFSYAAAVSPVLSGLVFRPISDFIEVFGGLQVGSSRQGMKFQFADGGIRVIDRCINDVGTIDLMMGAAFNATQNWQIRIAPSVFYAFLWAQENSSTNGVSGNGYYNSVVNWQSDWNYKTWGAALQVQSSVKLIRALYFDLSASAQFKQSPELRGTITLSSGSAPAKDYTASQRPYLWYAGAGLSFRFGN